MKTWKVTTTLTLAFLAMNSPTFAQPSSHQVFVDGSAALDRDPVERFHGSPDGHAVRAAIGRASGRHDWRLEVDVPSSRITDSDYTGPMYCAQDSSCGPGYVPSHVHERFAERTISAAVLYAQHLPELGRIEFALIGGGAIESQVMKYSQENDILDSTGRVVSHNAYAHDYPVGTIAGVIGMDARVRVTSHLAVVPQLRYHFFPYPEVSILRTGVALRWRF